MPWDPTHKLETRKRLLASAARLFTNKGFDNVGIEDIAKDAGLTRGVFYRYFSSKSELYSESILHAAKISSENMKASVSPTDGFTQQIKSYLSMEHREGERAHCPLAFLTTDIAHRNDEVRNTYTHVFNQFVEKVQKQSDKNITRATAIQQSVLMIGGLAISRAINRSDLAEELLEVCIESIEAESLV